MKKFFSYLLTFVSLFAISTVVTIQSQADLLNSQPSSSAGASSPTTLLAGIMESIEQNPKLDINGEISVDYNGELIGVTLDADIDLTTLTNPSIMASVGLSIYGNNYQILLTYSQDEIFLSCQNVSIQSKISEITDIAGLIGSLIGQPMAMPSIDLSSISLDAIMEALNNPQKKEVDNSTFYTITLPQIAKITIATDNQFNIQSITIDEFYMVEDLNIECGIKVSQDNNINIIAPDDSDQYLNIAGLIDGLFALKDKNMQLSAITNIYKGQLLFERVESIGFAQISQNKYQLKNSVSGALDANLDINYLNDVIYAKLNNIGVSVENQDIQYFKDLIKNTQTGEVVSQTANVLEDFLVWIENNYNSILGNATIASNQITLVLPMDGILGQTQDVKIVLKIKDLQIEAISLSGISVGDYVIYTTIYVREFQNYEISVTEDEYFKLSTATAMIDWCKQIKTIDVSAGLQVDFGEGTTQVDLSAQFDTINNRQQIKTMLFDMPISVLQQDSNLYVNINDMYVSAKMQSIYGLFSQIIPQEQVDQLLNAISRVATNLTINDIFTLVDIETTNNAINISTDLSHLIGKTLKVDVCLAFDNGFVLTINQLKYDNISISGEISATNIDEELEISNADKYLVVEDLIDYVDQFVCSQNYSISGRVDFSGFGIDQVFDGLITLDLANESLQISGLLTGKLNADIDIVYTDAICYVTYNNQKISISKQKLELLLNHFGIDIQPLLNSVSQFVADKNNFSLKDYLNSILQNPQVLSNTAQEVESSNKEQITIDQVIELIKNVKISKTNISADLSTLGYNIQFELSLHNDISLNFAMDEQFRIDASLQIGKQQAQYIADGNFADLDLLVPRILTITDLLKHKHFSGRVSIAMGELQQPIIVDYKASFSDGIKLSFTTNIEGLDIELLYINGEMFVKIGDICATVSTDQLMYIASRLFEDQITEISNTLTQTLDMSLDDILNAVYQITTGDPIISNLYNSEGSTHITLLNMLEIVLAEKPNKLQVEVHYQDLNVGASVNYGEEIQISAPLGYLNIVDFVTKIDEWLTSSTYTISGEIDFSGYGIDQKFNGDISVDFQNTALAIDGKLTGKINADIKLIYANEKFFVTYNKQNFVISQDQLVKLLQEFGIDISGVFDQIQEIANIKNSLSLSSIANSLLDMQPLSQEETLSIDIQQIVEIVQNITVNSTQIGIQYDFGRFDINATMLLGDNPQIVLELETVQMIIGANLCLNKTYTMQVDDIAEYRNLDYIAQRVPQLLDLISKNNFAGQITLGLGDQNFIIDYALFIDVTTLQFELSLETTLTGIDIQVYISNEQIYLKIGDIYVNITVEQLVAIITNLFGEEIDELVEKLEQMQNVSIDDVLGLVEKVTSDREIVTDIHQNAQTTIITILDSLTISYSKTYKYNLDVAYNGKTAGLTISATSGESCVNKPNAESYLNIVDFVTKIDEWLTSSTYTISGEIDFSGYGIDQKFNGDISVDFQNTALAIDGKLTGKINADIKLIYANEKFFVTYNKQNFVISQDQLVKLLQEFGIDISGVFDQIQEIANIKNSLSLSSIANSLLDMQPLSQEETLSIDIQQIVEIVQNITVNSTQIAFNGALGCVNIDINIPFGAIISPNVSIISQEMQIFLGLDLSKQVDQTKFDTTNSAFSLDNSANIVNGLLNTISDSQFSGEIYLNWGEQNTQTISATYDINIVDSKLYGKFAATYLGQDITLYIIENKLYVNVKGIYIKATFEQIEQILQTELPQDIKTQIDDKIAELQSQTNDIFKLIEDITNTEFIDDLQITPNNISISVMGAHVDVGIANCKISTISLLCGNISARITLSSSESSQQLYVEDDVYQDIDNIYSLVKNVYNYAMAQEFNFDIRLNAFGYDIVGFVGYDQGLTAHLTTTLLNKTLMLDIIDETIYINFDGLTLHIAFADIPTLIEEINSQFNLGISQDVLNVINKLLATKDITIADIENLIGSQESINLQDVLETLAINWFAGQIEVSYDIVNLAVEIVNNMISKLTLNAEISNQNIVAEVVLCDSKAFALPNAGIDIADATTFVKHIAKLVNKTQYAGEFSLTYTDIQLDGQYKLAIVDNKLSAQISTTFYDLPISVIIVDDVVYAQIDNVKIYLPLAEINSLTQWINNSFNQTLPTDINISTNLANATGEMSLDGITLGDIVIAITEEILSVGYKDLSANIGFADSTQISIAYKDVSANLSLRTTNEDVVAPDGYLHYTQFTNIVDSLVDLYNSGNISATAQAYVYEGQNLHYTADCALQIDLNSRLVFVSVNIVDEFKDSTMALMLAYKEDYWYVDYNNLKLKINKTDLKEILAILLEMVGIDPSLLPFLSDVVGGLDVNTDSLTAIVPQLDFTNPLSLIDVFEKISLTADELSVEVDNSLIAGELNSENILAALKTQNGKLNYVSLNNLYTGTTDYETLDFTLNFQDFNGVSNPYQGTYIDLSGANELIKAIINTAELNYFEITATIDVDMKIIGIPISMSVPMNVKIRLDENRKPEMMISLGSIPSIVGVNNDISSIDSRMWYIYYKDSYIYMLRHDIDDGSIFSSGTVYQKQIKLHVDSFFDDFFYYLQWGVGFSDTIMTEIEKALALTDGWTPDLGKVINSFTVTDAQNFSVDVNMGEVANNPQIDNMVVNLGVVNNAETNNKNYIGTAQFYLYMPVASGVDINLVSKDMKLINIGKPFDFTDFEKFVYNYVGTEGTEYSRDWNASNGTAWDYDGKAWQLASEREYTITFNSQGGQEVSAITGKTNQEITLPTLADKIVVDADAGIRYTYTFAGWYETELCKNGTEFTSNTIPKKNITLYAKWVLSETERVVTILFDSTGGSAINSISGYAGSQVDVSGYVPTKQDSYVYKKETGALWWKKYIYDKTTYTFDGWYIDSACTIKFNGIIPESNITLYAKWIGTTTEVQLDSKVN